MNSPPSTLKEACMHLSGLHIDALVVFLIAPREVGRVEAEEKSMAQQIARWSHEGGARMLGCWRTEEIVSAGKYELVYSPDSPPRWQRGTIDSLINAPAMETLIAHGELPEASRGDAAAYFSREGDEEEAIYPQPAEAQSLAAAASKNPQILTEIMEEARDLLERGPKDRQALEHLALLLGHCLLRDALINLIFQHPDPALTMLYAIARKTRGEIRANALCLYSVAAMCSGRGWRVHFALHAAEEEMPEHRLTYLMRQLFNHCGFEGVLETVRSGSRAILDVYG
ncbi:DUF4192 domain-containing protein [Corynebacterium lowii]|nr:DUF4192 domain-containing protein [Corynebacterium lowii]